MDLSAMPGDAWPTNGSLVSRLITLGWTYDANGVLQQPPGLPRVSLIRERDLIGDRYYVDGDLLEEATAFDPEAYWRDKERRDSGHLKYLGL